MIARWVTSADPDWKNIPQFPGWHVCYDPPPIPIRKHDYSFVHDEYDGTNGLAGIAASYEDALEQIREMKEERNE